MHVALLQKQVTDELSIPCADPQALAKGLHELSLWCGSLKGTSYTILKMVAVMSGLGKVARRIEGRGSLDDICSDWGNEPNNADFAAFAGSLLTRQPVLDSGHVNAVHASSACGQFAEDLAALAGMHRMQCMQSRGDVFDSWVLSRLAPQ